MSVSHVKKNNTGEIKYCIVCAMRDDKSFISSIYAHDLTVHKSGGWGCNGTYGKDKCLSNNKTSGILRLRYVPCDYDQCKYCLVNYH